MNRRHFVGGLAATFLTSSPLVAVAQSCVQLADGTTGCTVSIGPGFKIVVQNCPDHCWAASLSALFGFHGHPIDQNVIARALPSLTPMSCSPSGGSAVLNSVLTSSWTDANGTHFQASISGLFDPAHSITSLPNAGVIAELQAGRPLLYCNTTHCMVQLGMKFRHDNAGNILSVDEVTVADPFPGQGFRILSQAERGPRGIVPGGQMTYLAAVSTTP